jgi:hypothetical protein
MRKRPLVVMLVNVVVFCVAAEALALGIFYYQHGWLFYIYPYKPAHAFIPETERGELTLEGLHPYFGPTHKAGVPFQLPLPGAATGVETNNYGFSSRVDYPFARQTDRQLVIGILGGSVGEWFCHMGTSRLITRLQENRFFRDRDLVPICMSHQGYKQPQQLLVLAYFLSIGQPFDLVINISGFNEVALSGINDERGTDISMPSAVHMDPLVNLVNQATLTADKLESLATINRLKQRLNDLAARLDDTWFASTNVVVEQLYAINAAQYQEELRRFDRLPGIPSERSLIHVTPRVRERTGEMLYDEIAANWVTSSTLMHAMLETRGVPYFDFLQPNQYYAQRTFSPEEASLALTDDTPFKRGVEQGYPALERALVSRVPAAGPLRLTNATRIFDNEPAPVYADNCCHYNARGNEMLADFIAATILNSEGAWK